MSNFSNQREYREYLWPRVTRHSVRLVSHSYAGRTSITPSTLAIERVASKRSDQRRVKIDRRKDMRLKKVKRAKRMNPRRTKIRYALEILFRLGMPIYRVPSSPSDHLRDTWLPVRMHPPFHPIGQAAGVKINNVRVPSKSSRYVNSSLNSLRHSSILRTRYSIIPSFRDCNKNNKI